MGRDLMVFLAVVFGVWIIRAELTSEEGDSTPLPLPNPNPTASYTAGRAPLLTQTQISAGLFGNPSGLQTELP